MVDFIVMNKFMASGKEYSRGEVIPEEVALTWKNLSLLDGVFIIPVGDEEDEDDYID